MKILISLLSVLYSVTTLAGISGGNIGPRPVSFVDPIQQQPNQIVFLIAQDTQKVQFVVGEIQNSNHWSFEAYELSASEVSQQPELLYALKNSQITRDWARLHQYQ